MNAWTNFFTLKRNIWKRNLNGLLRSNAMVRMILCLKTINAQQSITYFPIRWISNFSMRLKMLNNERKNYIPTLSKIFIKNLAKYWFNNHLNFGKHWCTSFLRDFINQEIEQMKFWEVNSSVSFLTKNLLNTWQLSKTIYVNVCNKVNSLKKLLKFQSRKHQLTKRKAKINKKATNGYPMKNSSDR